MIKSILSFRTKFNSDNLLNYLRSWSLTTEKNSLHQSQYEGSVSGEDNSYVSVVQIAAADDKYFRKFKSNREYREILEHVTKEQGKKYLDIIRAYDTASKGLEDFIRIDSCKPYRYTYEGIGRVSPTNLRYGKVALDLMALFGDMSSFRIAEIGIGYGGQLQAILAQSGFQSYTFFDLPPVISLARKYLTAQSLGSFELNSPLEQSQQENFDLVISNYAFSELDRESQEKYFSNVIKNSTRGYLIYNEITPKEYNSMGIDEFVSRVSGSIVVNEYPLTSPKNHLVVWGFDDIGGVVLN